MVPKIQPFGTSFIGANNYYSQDKGAVSDERVDWVATRNLATDNPHVAARVMAATAMIQNQLKAEAGIKNTGRKSAGVVMTYTLAWHPDEKEHLTRGEMMQAADDTIAVLGAAMHQAVIYAHNDTDHPHIHIMINRVSPIDGRMLTSSLQRLKLSKWAQAYEEGRGHIYCEERVSNNKKREETGEYVRGEKDQPRHIFEAEIKAGDIGGFWRESVKAIKQDQRHKDAKLAKYRRELQRRHEQQWEKLSLDHKQRKKTIKQNERDDIENIAIDINNQGLPALVGLVEKLETQRAKFLEQELKSVGRLQNMVAAIKSLSKTERPRVSRLIAEICRIIMSSKSRQEQLERMQKKQMREFQVSQKKQIAAARRKREELAKAEVSENLDHYYEERKAVKFEQSLANVALEVKWRQRNLDRNTAWRRFRFEITSFREIQGKLFESSSMHLNP